MPIETDVSQTHYHYSKPTELVNSQYYLDLSDNEEAEKYNLDKMINRDFGGLSVKYIKTSDSNRLYFKMKQDLFYFEYPDSEQEFSTINQILSAFKFIE